MQYRNDHPPKREGDYFYRTPWKPYFWDVSYSIVLEVIDYRHRGQMSFPFYYAELVPLALSEFLHASYRLGCRSFPEMIS